MSTPDFPRPTPPGSAPPLPPKTGFAAVLAPVPVWLRLVILGVAGLAILIGISAIKDANSGPSPNSSTGIIQTDLIGTTVADGETVTNAQCAPASLRTWGDGSISENCTVTFSGGDSAIQFVEELSGGIEDEESVPSLTSTP